MGKRKSHLTIAPQRSNWRAYQHRLQRPQRRTFNIRWAVVVTLAMAALYTLYLGVGSSEVPAKEKPTSETSDARPDLINKKDVRLLLADLPPQELFTEHIQVPISSQHLQIDTSLDLDLQTHLLKKMDRVNSSLIGIAVMEADTGRMLALAGFNKNHPDDNPCLLSSFPAASVFKIVTAAAAVDHCGYNADTVLHFNGYKHTLYKSQLKTKINKYTTAVSFKKSFAQSINPVFGKLGVLKLQKSVLEEYATAFGFNQPIDFELSMDPSHFKIEPNEYHWAEIASGFNRDTTLSPVHAAMMVSAVLNQGRMVTPTVVDRITDPNGQLLYKQHPGQSRRAMTSKAARVLTDLMETTVRSGTGRKSFRDQRKHKVLSKLQIGGKTGSIYNRSHDARFDWFVGFAKEKKGSSKLVIAVVVAHEEYIGTRATQYARMAISHYFKTQLAQNGKKTKLDKDS